MTRAPLDAIHHVAQLLAICSAETASNTATRLKWRAQLLAAAQALDTPQEAHRDQSA